MDFRTVINIKPSSVKITYNDPVIFIGSCFANSIGRKFESGHMPVLINPSGTVYNPVSIISALDYIIKGIEKTREDLFEYEGRWLSFDHYTDFSSNDPQEVLQKINSAGRHAHIFIEKAKFLFITFGTARVYRLKKTGDIVSNCHKIPADHFTEELLQVKDIIEMWTRQLDTLRSDHPQLKVIFTISPVRHWKDGAYGNMVSKSSLFLAIEELLKHPSGPMYFPAYELLMDDLRDYRFYEPDMLHPSQEAIGYVWERFILTFFDQETISLWKESENITRGIQHIIRGMDKNNLIKFSDVMLKKISDLEKKIPGVNFTSEKDYFKKII